MGRRRGSMTQVIARRKQVAKLRLEGKTLAEISKEVGIHQSNVNEDLRYIERQWIAETQLSYREKCREKEADLLRVRNQAWEAYFVSCTEKKPEGNPRFLTIAASCDAKICNLYHLDDADIFARNELIASGDRNAIDGASRVVELIVENRSQVRSVMRYEEFREISGGAIPYEDEGDDHPDLPETG